MITKPIKIGNIMIGNGNRIAIQSMTNTDSSDYESTISQINKLAEVGCDIVRLAISCDSDISSAKKLIERVSVPLVADIQFNYEYAVKCAEIGFAKIRFNPGNIGDEKKVRLVVDACKSANIPIRIGVNAGSLDKNIKNRLGTSADALIESAINHVRLLEKYSFYDIVISVKASNVVTCVEAYKKLAAEIEYPLHIGITESGGGESALIKSAIGIGSLLVEGIGDTIRVSLSDDPIKEVEAAKNILRAIGMDKKYCEIVSCPTCSRCKYDLISIVKEMQDYVKNIDKAMKIAIMGCVVNGPGEAEDADFGVAGGDNKAVIFEKGRIVKTIPRDQILTELKKRVDEFK